MSQDWDFPPGTSTWEQDRIDIPQVKKSIGVNFLAQIQGISGHSDEFLGAGHAIRTLIE